MKKFLIIIFLGLFLNTTVLADKRFDKDLVKISKLNTFVNKKGQPYGLDKDINKKNTLIIIYTHGSLGGEQKLNGCKPAWAKIPPSIYQLDGAKIKNLTIKTYQLCSGVRGWTQKEEDIFWDTYDYNNQDVGKVLNLTDKNEVLLIKKWKFAKKQKVIKLKIDEFKTKGFNNIVLAGHSAGAWASLILQSNLPSEIDGVIGFNPAKSGKFAKEFKKKKSKVRKGWVNWRDYKISLIKLDKLGKILVYSHDLDDHESPKTLSFLSNSKLTKFIDLSDTECKGKLTLGGYHGITLTKCFAKSENNIVRYLEQIF